MRAGAGKFLKYFRRFQTIVYCMFRPASRPITNQAITHRKVIIPPGRWSSNHATNPNNLNLHIPKLL
jgi:hypothetical protein